jgi:hypothetical protein
LDEQLLDIEKHGFKALRKALIVVLLFYISFSPQTAAVFLIDYFKLDPSITLEIIQIALPLLLGITLARTVSLLWYAVFLYAVAYIIAGLVLAILLPLLWMSKEFSVNLRTRLDNKLTKFLDKVSEKQRSKPKPKSEILLLNKVVTAILVVGLFIAMNFNTPVGRLWNGNYNKELNLVAHLHYYCQLTGNYNEDQCKKWKEERLKYKRE